MKPILFEQANRTLTAPAGQENEVETMYVYTDGQQCISKWQLTDDEIEMVIKNRHLYISVMFGGTQPPILPMVHSPFTNLSEYIMVIGGEEGLFINGRQVFDEGQVVNKTYMQAWGINTPVSNWVARKILMIAVGDETVCKALDTLFR
jgi:hypothetical protein